MSYVVLARKWRPQTFDDLVGQGHVSQTLANAIANDRVAHAFLFTGVRGVGKTTSARILAKALNCMSAEGPTATPCMNCSACNEITDGRDVDVMEIDGASYNGVDEVRRLQESLPYRPNRDRFKIYIVDEVHMLSTSAWNAFLKTLEEPPPHVKFIFATTEVHKVPVTILSRVQRFDFKLIPTRLIVERLRFVLENEKVEADSGALTIIAREAAGSMRDAMSLLDQVLAWRDQRLTGEDVAQVLGVANRQTVHALAGALLEGDAAKSVLLVGSLANQGFDMSHVARDVLSLLRDIVIAATCTDLNELIDLPDDELTSVKEMGKYPSSDLIRVHQGFSAGYDSVARSPQPRAALEMLMVKLAARPPLVPIDDLIARLIRLEKKIHGGPGGAGPSGNPSAGRGQVPPPLGRGVSSSKSGSSPTPLTVQSQPPRPAEARPARPERSTDRSTTNPESDVTAAEEPPKAKQPESRRPLVVEALPSETPLPASHEATDLSRMKRRAVGNSEVPVPSFEDATALQRWRMLVDLIRPDDAKVAAFLDHAQVTRVDQEEISVGFEQDSIFEVAASDIDTRSRVRAAAEKLLKGKPEINLKTGMKRTSEAETVADEDRLRREQRRRAAIEDATFHPFVQEAVRVFEARVRAIELPKS